jgi:hypothetical protein
MWAAFKRDVLADDRDRLLTLIADLHRLEVATLSRFTATPGNVIWRFRTFAGDPL